MQEIEHRNEYSLHHLEAELSLALLLVSLVAAAPNLTERLTLRM